MPPDTADIVARARKFRREIVEPNAARWERERKQPLDALKSAAAAGLLGLEVPVDQGGLGADFMTKLAVIEELSRGCMAFTFSMINSQNVGARLARGGTDRHRAEIVPRLMAGERFAATALSEPGAGSDFAAIATRAEKTGDGWVLNGEKGWITNAPIADYFVTYAQTDPAQGWRGIASFLIDARAPGFVRGEAYDLMGGHAIGAGGFRLTDCLVPDEDVLGQPGAAFKAAMAGVNQARTYVAAMCAGMLAASLEAALGYAAGRETFGKKLIEHQGLRWSLAQAATDLEAIRGLVQRAGTAIADGGDAVMPSAQAKKFATETALARIADCIQAMGANGLKAEYPLGRHLACAKIAAYTDGSIEMMNERIGAGLISAYGLEARGR